MPGAFGGRTAQGQPPWPCDEGCFDEMAAADAAAYFEWAKEDPRVDALIPWHFYTSPAGGSIPCNTGVADMPLTRAKWEQIGKSIVGADEAPAASAIPVPPSGDGPGRGPRQAGLRTDDRSASCTTATEVRALPKLKGDAKHAGRVPPGADPPGPGRTLKATRVASSSVPLHAGGVRPAAAIPGRSPRRRAARASTRWTSAPR